MSGFWHDELVVAAVVLSFCHRMRLLKLTCQDETTCPLNQNMEKQEATLMGYECRELLATSDLYLPT